MARVLIGFSACCSVVGLVVCGFLASLTMGTPADGDSEWGRYGSCGGMFGIGWLFSIVLPLIGLILGVAALSVSASFRHSFSRQWKWCLAGTFANAALLITHIVLWLVFYLLPHPYL